MKFILALVLMIGSFSLFAQDPRVPEVDYSAEPHWITFQECHRDTILKFLENKDFDADWNRRLERETRGPKYEGEVKKLLDTYLAPLFLVCEDASHPPRTKPEPQTKYCDFTKGQPRKTEFQKCVYGVVDHLLSITKIKRKCEERSLNDIDATHMKSVLYNAATETCFSKKW